MGPITHPICAMLHANDSTPDPITAVITCADAVHTVPAYKLHTHEGLKTLMQIPLL